MAEHCLPISEVTSRITLKITGLKGFSIRLGVAAQLFKLGAWIAGVGIEIDRDVKP